MGEDVTRAFRRRGRLVAVGSVGDEHVGGDGRVRGMHAPGRPQRVVDVDGARRLLADVDVVELVDGDVGEADPRHPRLRARR